MNRLNELLARLCPTGVEYLKVGDVCSTITDFTAAGSFADIANNVKYITNEIGFAQLIRTTDLKSNFLKPDSFVYVDEHAFKYLWRVSLDSEGLVMPNVGNCGEVYYVNPDTFPSKSNVLGPNAIWVKSNIAMNRFLYHLFQCKEFQDKLIKIISPVGQTKFNKTNFKELTIPVPPLPVQREIVRILDNFTELTTALTEELVTRQKQFAYYRDELFNFRCTKMVLIPEIADVFIGLVTTMTSHYVPVGVPLIFNSCIKENRFIFEKRTYLDEDFANKNSSRRHKVGDVITVHTGDVGTSAIIGKDLDGSLGFATIVSRIKNLQQIKPQYLCHYLNSNTCKRQIATMIKGDRDNLNLKDFKKIKIPIPSLEEQSRIVSILDRFDALCNDLTSGLPAEIAARQKQYEYYRDKLLTFKEKV